MAINLYFTTGAGGRWLEQILHLEIFPELNYINFHQPHDRSKDRSKRWCIASHSSTNFDLTYSGEFKFNFFCNHVYKQLHHTITLYEEEYSKWFKKSVACAYGIEKEVAILDKIDFDFGDLLQQPNSFLEQITDLQKKHNQPTITDDKYFFHSRELFLNSCVNTDNYYKNFDSVWWVIFVLGQLMEYNIYPEVDIGLETNYNKVRDFAWKNQDKVSICKNWSNPAGPCLDTILKRKT
jgi:hypothetical protein